MKNEFLPFKKGALSATEVAAGSYPVMASKSSGGKDSIDGGADQGLGIVEEAAGKGKPNSKLDPNADISSHFTDNNA